MINTDPLTPERKKFLMRTFKRLDETDECFEFIMDYRMHTSDEAKAYRKFMNSFLETDISCEIQKNI